MSGGTFTEEAFGPGWTGYTVEWTGSEVDPATVPQPPPWPAVVDGQLRAPERVYRVRRLIVRKAGEPTYLVATGWGPRRGWDINLRGLHGSDRHPVALAGVKRILRCLRLVASLDPGGRPVGRRTASRQTLREELRARPEMTDDQIAERGHELDPSLWSQDPRDDLNERRRIAAIRKDATK